MQLLVGKFLLLQRDELETLEQEPEEFYLKQQTSHWKCGLRPGAESLLVRRLFAVCCLLVWLSNSASVG